MYTKSSILSLMNCAKEQSENWTLNRFNSNIILKHRTTEAQCFAVCCHILAFVILIFEFHVSADSGSDSSDISSNSGGGTSTTIDTTASSNKKSIQTAYTLVGQCSGQEDDVQWGRTQPSTTTTTRHSH